MTEEQRIIRITKEELLTLNEGHNWGEQWEELEPAPPISWRPVCFYNWSDKLGLCEMSDLKEFVKDHLANCEQCPFRK